MSFEVLEQLEAKNPNRGHNRSTALQMEVERA